MFRSWCKSNGFCRATNLSHVLMDGGVLSVPFDRLNDFYEKYVECVNAGERLFVVEQKTIDAYNFFVDLDYKDDDAMSLEDVQRVCRVICDKVSKYGGKSALISVAKPKTVGDYIKTGVHINWPGFPVNRSSAIALRDHVIRSLNIAYGSKDWNSIVDLSVYGSSEKNTKGSGFRMPWSHKRGKHEACNGSGCNECNGTGKETQGEYLPVFIYKHDPTPILERVSPEPSVELMHMATIRTTGVEPNIIEGSKKVEGSFTAAQIKNEYTDPETITILERFIRLHMEGQTNAKVTKIYKEKNSYLVATTSRYCENTKRAHGSNHVWFHILGDTICQKCFCRCETIRGRHYGFCKDFSGRKHQLPSSITDKLQVTKYKPIPKRKDEAKPSEDNIKDELKTYIHKHIFKTDFEITNIKKQKGIKKRTVLTDQLCLDCSNEVHFNIEKNTIQQACGCSNRKHMLIDKIATKL